MTKTVKIVEETTPPPPAPEEKRKIPTLEFLQVPYTHDELLDLAEKLARAGAEKERLEEIFEVQRLDFKHQFEALESTMRDLVRKIGRRSQWQNVQCTWILETPSADEKTLVRMDTGEVVKTVPMSDHDYQDRLPEIFKDSSAKISADDFKLKAAADVDPSAAAEPTKQ